VFGDAAADRLAEAAAALRLARDLDAPEGSAYALWLRSEALGIALDEQHRLDEAAAAFAESDRTGSGRVARRGRGRAAGVPGPPGPAVLRVSGVRAMLCA
jgi:hypothetical protein